MSAPDRLPREALDGLLDGSPSEEAAGTPLATYLEALRNEATSSAPTPSDELRMVLDEGLDPSELGAREATAASGGFLLGWRGRLVARALVTKFAALGLVTKMAVSGAAVTVAASGAGAAGVLPPPAQSTFDDVVGREAPAEHDEDGEGGDVDEVQEAPSADTPPPLETDVPGDATGTSDGEPGVDGGDVADDASDEPPARERTEDTPAGEVLEELPANDRPAQEAPPREDGATGRETPVGQEGGATGREPPTGQGDAEQQGAEQGTTMPRPDASASEQAASGQRPARP